MTMTDVALFIDPPSYHFQRDRLFSTSDSHLNRDDALAPYRHMRDFMAARGIPVYTADRLANREVRARLNVYVSLGVQEHFAALARRDDVVLSAFFAVECPIVEPRIYRGLAHAGRYFKRLYSWSDGESLVAFTGRVLPFKKFHWPQVYDGVLETFWNQKRRGFLVMINSNKLPRVYWRELYTERLRAVHFFNQFEEIDLYGVNWDEVPSRVGRTRIPNTLTRLHRAWLKRWDYMRPNPLLAAARRANRGPIESKFEALSKYSFAICFENMVLKGWITEKIFDCFYAGTVPIYLGAPDVTDYIPRECFIDMREFSGYSELRSYLKSLNEGQIQAFRDNAREFLSSERFRPFSKQSFTDHFRLIVNEDSGKGLV
jgi:alpha(1,3/1,4) fucosyltransferase